MTFIIEGPPRTKKTSNRLVRVRGRHVVLPSKANETWARAAVLQLRAACARLLPLSMTPPTPIGVPVNCRAVFYRDANRGDLIGYMQALADALEDAFVLANDRLIVSWNGTQMLVDRARPRVVVTLEPVGLVVDRAA